MGIVDEDIAKVRSSTDFVAVASEHLALRRVGTRWVGLCPFHAEKTPSFGLNSELGFYYCFGCGAKGDVITFVREIEHLDFVEAVEKLAARAGITLRYDERSPGQDQRRQRREHIYQTLEAAIEWYHQRLLSAPDAAAARRYLRSERGYDGDVVRQYRLGWAPDGWDQLVRALGVPAPALVDAGLAQVDESGRFRDFFRARLLFPIFEPGGKPVGAGGRMLPGGRGPKYKNTSATAVYDKSDTLYGLNWAKKAVVDAGQVVVCEGYTDVIGLQRAGVMQAVATCGTSLADGHIKRLKNFARKIVLAYDADAAGQAAAERYYEWEQRLEVEIRVAALPEGVDPADLAQQDPTGLAQVIAESQPYLGFRLDRLFGRSDLAGPEGRVRAAEAAMALVAEHPNELVRDQYVMQVADRCRVEPDRLRKMAAAGGDSVVAGSSRADSVASRGEAPTPVPLSGPELEALRLAVHQPEAVAHRLEAVLFAHPLARVSFEALMGAETLHDAIEAADPQAADLLQRLVVEGTDTNVDAVITRLVDRAGARAVHVLQLEVGAAEPARQRELAQTLDWLNQTLQSLRRDELEHRTEAVAAEEGLVVWLAARDEAERHGGTEN